MRQFYESNMDNMFVSDKHMQANIKKLNKRIMYLVIIFTLFYGISIYSLWVLLNTKGRNPSYSIWYIICQTFFTLVSQGIIYYFYSKSLKFSILLNTTQDFNLTHIKAQFLGVSLLMSIGFVTCYAVNIAKVAASNLSTGKINCELIVKIEKYIFIFHNILPLVLGLVLLKLIYFLTEAQDLTYSKVD